jgi:hypothetical protein
LGGIGYLVCTSTHSLALCLGMQSPEVPASRGHKRSFGNCKIDLIRCGHAVETELYSSQYRETRLRGSARILALSERSELSGAGGLDRCRS